MFSNRVNNIKESSIVKYNNIVKQKEKEGICFYKLNIGQPDILTDISYFNELKNYKQCTNSYSNPQGLVELRNIVSEYYNKKTRRNKYKQEDIVITQGASDGIIKILLTLCDKDDEIIVLEPFFSDYKIYCNLLDVKIKTIIYSRVDYLEIKEQITSRTRAILFANPNNPDGNILSKNAIETIISIAKEYHICIISDEVYNEIIFTNKYISLSNFDYENIIIVDSASKKLNNCGSRIGFIISKNDKLISKIVCINDSKISISNIEQKGVASLLLNYQKITNISKKIYTKRLKKVIKLLQNTNIKFEIPKGGISILLDLPITNSNDYAFWLINNYNKNGRSLVITPAQDFYMSTEGKNKIRITLTIDDGSLNEVINILVDSLKKFRNEVEK